LCAWRSAIVRHPRVAKDLLFSCLCHLPVLISCCDMYCRLQDAGGSFRCANSVLGARKSLAALGLRTFELIWHDRC
jgi:hypothetical protein